MTGTPSSKFIVQGGHALTGGWVVFLGFAIGHHLGDAWLGAKYAAAAFYLYAFVKETLWDWYTEGEGLVRNAKGETTWGGAIDLVFLLGGSSLTLAIGRVLA